MSTKPSAELRDQWHEDPSNWKPGVFYFNRADKRLLPPKRVKAMGWTVNFANPVSILVLIAMTAVIVLLTDLSA